MPSRTNRRSNKTRRNTRPSLKVENLELRRLMAADVQIIGATDGILEAETVEAAEVTTLITTETELDTTSHEEGPASFGFKTRTREEVFGENEEEGELERSIEAEVSVLEAQDTEEFTSGKFGAAGFKGSTKLLSTGGKASGEITETSVSGELEAEANLITTKQTGFLESPDLTADGETIAFFRQQRSVEGSVGAKGSGEISLGLNGGDILESGVNIEGEVFAGAEAKIGSEGEIDLMGVTSHTEAELIGRAGAEANATGSITGEGVSAEAGAFAGARAGLEGTQTIGGVGGSAGMEGFAGAGAEAELNASMKDGKFKVDVAAGAAIGLGGNCVRSSFMRSFD